MFSLVNGNKQTEEVLKLCKFVIYLPIFRCWLIPEWYAPHQQQHCDQHRDWNWCCRSGLHYYLSTLLYFWKP